MPVTAKSVAHDHHADDVEWGRKPDGNQTSLRDNASIVTSRIEMSEIVMQPVASNLTKNCANDRSKVQQSCELSAKARCND